VLAGASRQGGDVGVLNAPAVQGGGGADFLLKNAGQFARRVTFDSYEEESNCGP
jgi:hypothetical protein